MPDFSLECSFTNFNKWLVVAALTQARVVCDKGYAVPVVHAIDEGARRIPVVGWPKPPRIDVDGAGAWSVRP